MEQPKDLSNDPEINRKRKNNQEFQIPRKFPPSDNIVEEKEKDFLALSLSLYPAATKSRKLSPVHHHDQEQPTQPSLQPPPPPPLTMQFQPFFQQPPTSLPSPSPPPPSPPPPPTSHHPNYPVCMPPMPIACPGPEPSAQPIAQPVYRHDQSAGPSRPTRHRRNPSQEPREGKVSEVVPPPFPWATTQRATVHSLEYLVSKQMFKIIGEVHCKRCDRQFELEFDLREKFIEVGTFIAQNKSSMHDRAPGVWMNPVLPSCRLCEEENCVKPIIPEDKDAINWLFLLLGQLLGCCTLEQLKYFCKHTKNHRTGAKDRVLFLTYLGLCKQLDPNGPFDR